MKEILGDRVTEVHESKRLKGSPSCLINPDDTMSVSYTHLRAHETVLDLVCRLLLDKKTRTLNLSPSLL